MKVCVFGLGGVGGYFGGKLAARYGESSSDKVVFIARGGHLAAIKRQGLLVKAVEGDLLARPTLATDRPAEAGPCDVVLLCVKEYALTAASREMEPLLEEETVVIPVLNGVDIAERLEAMLPRGRALGGCVYISSFIEAPGVVRQVGGACRLIFGPTAGDAGPYRPVEAFFREAGIKAELASDINVPLWRKYLFVSPMAGVTALSGLNFGAVMADPKWRAMVLGLMGEIVSLAAAKGVVLPEDCLEAAVKTVEGFPAATKSSLQLDFERGSRTEMELFMGYAVRAGRQLGLPLPLHEELYASLKERESQAGGASR